MPRWTIDIPDDLAERLTNAVSAEGTATTDAAIRDAIRGWLSARDDMATGYQPGDLDRLADEGEASGIARDFDGLAFLDAWADGRRRHGVPAAE